MRLELDRILSPRYDLMVALQEDIREEAKKTLPSQKAREERLWEVLEDDRVWRMLETNPAGARRLAMERLVR
jgi:siroheme synthase (precorrin-2 oxidase/ferrochelatase)